MRGKEILVNWKLLANSQVCLFYSDKTKVLVSKKDFDRAFGAIINASKEEVLKDFAIKAGHTWKDIVCINGEIFAEEFSISGKMDNDDTYQVDDFIESVAKKHGVSADEMETYMLDGIDFNSQELPFGAEECGCYINGIAEWLMYPEE